MNNRDDEVMELKGPTRQRIATHNWHTQSDSDSTNSLNNGPAADDNPSHPKKQKEAEPIRELHSQDQNIPTDPGDRG